MFLIWVCSVCQCIANIMRYVDKPACTSMDNQGCQYGSIYRLTIQRYYISGHRESYEKLTRKTFLWIWSTIYLYLEPFFHTIIAQMTQQDLQIIVNMANTKSNQLFCLFDLILYVHSTIFQLCGTILPGFNQY